MIGNKLGPADRTVPMLIDRSYPVVKKVYLHLKEIQAIYERLGAINGVFDNLDQIQNVQEAADRLVIIGNHMEEILDVQNNIENISSIAPHIDEVVTVATNIDAVLNAKRNADKAQQGASTATEKAEEAGESAELAKKWAVSPTPVEGDLLSSKSYAEQSKSFKDDGERIHQKVAASETYLRGMETTYKALRDNEKNINLTAGNINSVINVATDLKGEIIDDMSGDLGMVGEDGDTGNVQVTGGNIKKVADDIDSVRIVAGSIEEVRNVSDIIDDIPQIREELKQFKEDITAQADRSQEQAEASEKFANASEVSAKRADVILRYVQVEIPKQLEAIKEQGAASAAEVAAEGTKQVEIVQAEGAEQLELLNAVKELAKDWAIKLDGPVEGEEYSSKYWAQQSASSAESSRTNAEDTASNLQAAVAKAQEAASSASAAKASEDLAAQYAAEAKESKDTVLADIESVKDSAITAVSSEGTKQIGLVQDKGTEVLDEISADVELTNKNAQIAVAQAQEATAQAERAKDFADQASQGQIQADWNETDSANKSFIRNKPDVYTKSEVDAKLVAAFIYKGSVATEAELPMEGNQVGWVYNANDTGANFAWNGTAWDDLGRTIDFSPYLTKVEAASTYLPLEGKAVTAGTADLALGLKVARNIALSGKVEGTATPFDGSHDISINVTKVFESDKATNDAENNPIHSTYRKLNVKLTLDDFISDGFDLGMVGE